MQSNTSAAQGSPWAVPLLPRPLMPRRSLLTWHFNRYFCLLRIVFIFYMNIQQCVCDLDFLESWENSGFPLGSKICLSVGNTVIWG